MKELTVFFFTTIGMLLPVFVFALLFGKRLMISREQIRAARALLDWSTGALATRSGLTVNGINKIERGHVDSHRATLELLEQIFAENGVEFIGTRGVALKDEEVVRLTGDNVFFRVLDDVVDACRNAPKAEALFACVVDKLSPPHVVENYRRLRREGIAMRSLIKEGDTYLMGTLREYRYLPAAYFHNNPFVIYGNKVATMLYDEASDQGKTVTSALIVRNAPLANAQRNLFNYIWSVAEKPRKTEAEIRYDDE
jgi:transcriptional regulator with XRE-family HTH domain